MPRLILVRGLPGSGKSTLADKLVPSMADLHFEADQYFMVDGEYKFDPNKLHLAHAWCQNKTSSCLRDGYSVVVSNTFTTQRELKPYFDIAKHLNLVPQVILCQGNWGNIHNVPEEALERMQNRFQYDIATLYNGLENAS